MKKKLYRIGNSKTPTPEIMLKMAENLRTKFGKHCMVRVATDAYDTTQTERIQYTIYIQELGSHRHFSTWPEALTEYRNLIRSYYG